MVKKEKKMDDKGPDNDDIEKVFESTWNNWSSRRRCESTHIPEIFKKEKREDNQ
ncbi:MAG: hypothetical protein JW891_02825 [Candidatus Lokiarchaeota archaeon]|nr:hypothetical protein [Candidatus Lokiarchaeota archaeon]